MHMMHVPVVFLDFQLRKDYIAENLCENRENVVMMCGGKCYLTKQLKKVEEKQSRENRLPEIKVIVIAHHLSSPFDFSIDKALESDNFPLHAPDNYSFLPCFDIFHPPLAA